MYNSLKVLSLAGFVLAVGGLSPLRAQTEMASAAASLQTSAKDRVYVGTTLRQSLSGGVTRGSIVLNVDSLGNVYADATAHGKTLTYSGKVAAVTHGPKGAGLGEKQRIGTLRAVALVLSAPGKFKAFKARELNITLTSKSAYGGMIEPNGSTLTFTASRVSAAFGNIVLPSGGLTPIGQAGTIGNGG